MAAIQKGIVTSIEGGKARVMSGIRGGDVTRPLTISDAVDKDSLIKSAEVAYVVFEDATGVILAKI